MSDELARLRAVEQAVKAELAEPGAITKAEIAAALATRPPATPADFDTSDFDPNDFG